MHIIRRTFAVDGAETFTGCIRNIWNSWC